MDSFVHSKITKSENGSYVFKGFEFSRANSERSETSSFGDAVRSLTVNDSVFDNSFSLFQSARLPKLKDSSFKSQRNMTASLDSPITVDTQNSTPSSATFG